MTRPHVIRADTIDLQDPDAPSAKDHSKQPARPGMLAEGAPAPHQAEALKHVELELSEQHGRSPRASADLSGKELQLLHDESEANGYQDPSENLLRNSAQHAAQDDTDDGDGDDGLDDDLGDKISSSPSIGDDGGYSVPRLPWPQRQFSVSSPPKKATHSPGPPLDELSSSPFEDTPVHYPISFPRSPRRNSSSKDHHHRGEYGENRLSGILVDEIDLGSGQPRSLDKSHESSLIDEFEDAHERVDESLDSNDFHHLLLPDEDSLLDSGVGEEESPDTDHETDSAASSPKSHDSWNAEEPAGLPDNDDDDSEDFSYDPDSRFVDSGWGGECLREIEDIDFEFVYALHTFVATVEGQANASKGDTMVLLDDSNSYWWLVRIVKDSSIGYLPAEHIETPLERLARLNKHRNLDLSQTMLGDQDDDKRQNPLNPLRKAMRRRNVKKVEFSASNSFHEPDDTQFSSDDEDGGESELNGADDSRAEEQSNEADRDTDQQAKVAPLNTKDRIVNGVPNEAEQEAEPRNGGELTNGAEQVRNSDDTFERNEDGTPGKSRKGTVRNTDSFFKDDSVETRKINLTPSLLRDDMGAPSSQPAQDPTDLRLRGNSLDSLEKDPPLESKKEDKKKKEKRGVLGGMFKRKDKKNKDKDRDTEDGEKTSAELSRKSPTPKESMESLASNNPASPHRQSSKLQKQRPVNMSPKTSYSGQNAGAQRPVSAGQAAAGSAPQSVEMNPKPSSAGSDMRLVLPESQPLFDKMPTPLQSKEHSPQDAAPATSLKGDAPDRNMAPTNQLSTAPRLETRPDQTRQPQQGPRAEAPGFRSINTNGSPIQRQVSQESQDRLHRTISHESQDKVQRIPSHESPQNQAQRTFSNELDERSRAPDPQPTNASDHHLALAQAAQHEPHPAPSQERLTSPTDRISPPTAQERSAQHQPPPLVTDTSSPSPETPSPVSPPSSPDLPSAPKAPLASTPQKPTSQQIPSTTTPSTSKIRTTDLADSPASTARTGTSARSLPAWSDASLRNYMDDDSEIRDLLIIVHDKTGVVPRTDHPVVKGLFKEENARLREIEGRLDGLLGQFYERRGRRGKV